MSEEKQILSQDLMILEKMGADMEAYLMSECTHWVMGNGDMPKLSIGGFLMRQHRLLMLCKNLQNEEQLRLKQAIEKFHQTLEDKVVRFEQRMNKELHARLSDWINYLRSLSAYGTTYAADYAKVVDTRVVIAASICKMKNFPYQLDPQIPKELATLDNNLQSRWQPGGFVWPTVWQPAYPHEDYWWLYGRPK